MAQHRRLAALWLGTLHGTAADLDLAVRLPARGPDHYLDHLRAAHTTILDNFDNPVLRAEDRDLLRALVSTCELIESDWRRAEAVCSNLPRTLVHGDLASRHLRLRRDHAGPMILAFDWELSGRGVPAADIHLLVGATRNDLACYRSTICDYVGSLDDDELQALLLVGNGFRLLACADWASTHLPYPRPEYGVETLYLFEQPLRAWAAALGSAA
jgi:aminoglycoside phosphotransferase (APT) family kinase protein